MRIVKKVVGADGVSTKYLQRMEDGFVVEATYIRRDGPERHTLCVSTQVGCVVGCRFCVSGLRTEGLVYQRSLTAAEMVRECCNITDDLDLEAEPWQITFAFMGEGEPFLNFDACVEAFRTLSGMEWPVPIRLSVSTSGVRPDRIHELAEVEVPIPLKLQVSLHGPTDEVRSQIVPGGKSVSEIVAATRAYRDRCARPVVWNYVLCEGVNDQPEHAVQLAALLGAGWRVKFTRLNPAAGSPFARPSRVRVEEFRRILEERGLSTTYSETDESNIEAGCGQLSYSHSR